MAISRRALYNRKKAPLEPAIAEDLLALLEKYPGLTMVQRAILKSAAAYLVEDHQDLTGEDGPLDPRLQMTRDEYHLVPDRIELIHGLPMPKHWETPNRLKANDRWVETQRRSS